MNAFSCGCKSQRFKSAFCLWVSMNSRGIHPYFFSGSLWVIDGYFLMKKSEDLRRTVLGGTIAIADLVGRLPNHALVRFNAPTQKMWSMIRRARTAQVNTLDLAPQHSSSLDSLLTCLQKKTQGFQQHTGRIIWEAEYEAQAYELGTWLKKNRSRKTWTQSHQVGSFVPIGNNIH